MPKSNISSACPAPALPATVAETPGAVPRDAPAEATKQYSPGASGEVTVTLYIPARVRSVLNAITDFSSAPRALARVVSRTNCGLPVVRIHVELDESELIRIRNLAPCSTSAQSGSCNIEVEVEASIAWGSRLLILAVGPGITAIIFTFVMPWVSREVNSPPISTPGSWPVPTPSWRSCHRYRWTGDKYRTREERAGR